MKMLHMIRWEGFMRRGCEAGANDTHKYTHTHTHARTQIQRKSCQLSHVPSRAPVGPAGSLPTVRPIPSEFCPNYHSLLVRQGALLHS